MPTITDKDRQEYEFEVDQRRDVIKILCSNGGETLATITTFEGAVDILSHDPSFDEANLKRELEIELPDYVLEGS